MQNVLKGGAQVPVENIQRDVDVKKTAEYAKLKPIMVVPGIYFLGKENNLIELLQGEITELQIGTALN